jgi:hypothetical protein
LLITTLRTQTERMALSTFFSLFILAQVSSVARTYAMRACDSRFDLKVTFGGSGMAHGERVEMSEGALRRCITLYGILSSTNMVNQVYSAYYKLMKTISAKPRPTPIASPAGRCPTSHLHPIWRRMAAPRRQRKPKESLLTTGLFCNDRATSHAVRRNTASCGKVTDKWWVISGIMLLLGRKRVELQRNELYLRYIPICRAQQAKENGESWPASRMHT